MELIGFGVRIGHLRPQEVVKWYEKRSSVAG
jgi:hypothetical protein